MKHRLALEMAVAVSLIMIIDLPRAWAVLGEAVSSVETDRVALAGQLSMIPAQLYTIQEITTSEIVVREYVSGDTVFAVAWRGRRPPNLVSLLGSYFQEYQEAAAAAASNGPRMRGMSPHPGGPCCGRNGRSSGRYTRKSLYSLTPPFGSDKRDDPMILTRMQIGSFRGCLNGSSWLWKFRKLWSFRSFWPFRSQCPRDHNRSFVCCRLHIRQYTLHSSHHLPAQYLELSNHYRCSRGYRIVGAPDFCLCGEVPLASSNLGECMFFGGGTEWGPVHTVDVVLGGEPAVLVPIHVIDPTFAGQYTSTGQPASNICGVAVVDSSPYKPDSMASWVLGYFLSTAGLITTVRLSLVLL